jgi:hypothetical protein
MQHQQKQPSAYHRNDANRDMRTSPGNTSCNKESGTSIDRNTLFVTSSSLVTNRAVEVHNPHLNPPPTFVYDLIVQINDDAIHYMKHGQYALSIVCLKRAVRLLRNRTNASKDDYHHQYRDSSCLSSETESGSLMFSSSSSSLSMMETGGASTVLTVAVRQSRGPIRPIPFLYPSVVLQSSKKESSEDHWIYQKVFPLLSSYGYYTDSMISVIVLYHLGLCCHKLANETGQDHLLKSANQLYVKALSLLLSSPTSSTESVTSTTVAVTNCQGLELVLMAACSHNVSCIGMYLFQREIANDMRQCVIHAFHSMIQLQHQSSQVTHHHTRIDEEDVAFFYTALLMADVIDFYEFAPCA